MEPPPLLAVAGSSAYDSSSTRFRPIHPLSEKLPSAVGGGAGKLRLMCSYNGHIIPSPHDKSLRYVGGETRMIVIDRNSSLSFLINRLSKTLITGGESFTLKYQLPNEELDSLISVTTNEDLENMIDEYDRISATQKSYRLRLFLFTCKKLDSCSSIRSLLENNNKTDDQFLTTLKKSNSTKESQESNNLLGDLNDEIAAAIAANDRSSEIKGMNLNRAFLDDERSEQGTRNPSQIQTHSPAAATVTAQPNPTGGIELLSPDSVSSEGSTMVYQDSTFINNNMVPIDQTLLAPTTVNDYGYLKYNNQHHHHHQFIQNGTNYINQSTPYYSIYPPPLPQHQIIYVTSRQTPSYLQPSASSSSSVGIANLNKPEMFMGSTELGLQSSIQVYSGQHHSQPEYSRGPIMFPNYANHGYEYGQ
ncbi:uncharacterized protein LOC124936896 [Impatiens glandulifera]|uniref:uncharacterized protein LOC124936896 n=1 Tax=Impatiens glandulifera TaxID=253017 RepID=UPI001FB0F59F|nr:uncharacterized protein LOC124936896 [Impatiens glandulifera]